jgi:hypothetical protein
MIAVQIVNRIVPIAYRISSRPDPGAIDRRRLAKSVMIVTLATQAVAILKPA